MLATEIGMNTEYFDESGLQKRTGIDSDGFDVYLIKELIDNAIDHLESTKSEIKQIQINYNNQELQIFDNGMPFNEDLLDKTLTKFDTFTSTKRNYISVQRGSQGNALKTVAGICYINNYQMQFVSAGKLIEYKYNVSLNNIEVNRTVTSINSDNKGITISNFEIDIDILENLIFQYYLANYHIEFTFNGKIFPKLEDKKIKHDHNIHFYGFDEFKTLLLATSQYNSKETTINFINQFDGINSRKYNENGLYKYLNQYSSDEEICELFDSLKEMVKMPTLKILDKYKIDSEQLKTALGSQLQEVKLLQSKSKKFVVDNIPMFLQLNLFEYSNPEQHSLKVITNVNNTISLTDFPFSCRIDSFLNKKFKNPVFLSSVFSEELSKSLNNSYLLCISFIAPKIDFSSYSKDLINAYSFKNELKSILESTLKQLITQSRQEQSKINTSKKTNITKLIHKYFDAAFQRAKGNYESVMARQVFYVIRELININEKIDIGENKNIYSIFTQKIVTDFQNNDEKYHSIFNERRGYFYDNFFNREIPLSTKDVNDFTGKNYLDIIKKTQSTQFNISPNQLYKHVLFIEKQGFTQLLKESNILNELNLGLICSQGFATRSSKVLIRYFNKVGIKVYCLHDCDLSGYNIKHNISNKSKTFKHDLEIEDIGIKVADVKKYNKLPEVYYSKTDYSNSKKKLNLTEEELEFFARTMEGNGADAKFQNKRVEINSFTNDELIEFLRDKIKPIEVIPSDEVLDKCIDIDIKAIVNEILFRKSGKELMESISIDKTKVKEKIYSRQNGEHWTRTLQHAINEYMQELIKEACN